MLAKGLKSTTSNCWSRYVPSKKLQVDVTVQKKRPGEGELATVRRSKTARGLGAFEVLLRRGHDSEISRRRPRSSSTTSAYRSFGRTALSPNHLRNLCLDLINNGHPRLARVPALPPLPHD